MRLSTGFAKSRRAAVWLFGALLVTAVAGVTVVRHWSLERALVIADPDIILTNPGLARFATAQGHRVFDTRCAVCHGADAKGNRAVGVPDLTDSEFLYGTGNPAEIEDIVKHGIRAGDRRGRNSATMPAYASLRPYDAEPIPPLTPAEMRDVIQALAAMGGHAADPGAATRGKALYLGKGGCYDCHGGDAQGDSAVGAPNLIDRIWLYGDGAPAAIRASIEHGRKGYSPAYRTLLTPAEQRAVAIYVALLPKHPNVREPQS